MKQDWHALVVDDDAQVRGFVTHLLCSDGWDVSEACTAEQAFGMLHEQQWELVVCDVLLGGADGYAVLRRFAEEQPAARVVLMTGHGSAVGAFDATAAGAYEYLLKPFEVDDLLAAAAGVRAHLAQREQHNAADEVMSASDYTSDVPLIGRSPAFVECLKLVGRVARTNLPVLITGESGTGKEVVARAIHHRSGRASGLFVAVNCGAMPIELIESELFGHARGAFTGADRDRRGLWEEADGGTILLDEITETTPLFQVKLLRALQQGEIRRVGSNQTLRVDARVIAVTNRDIEEETRHGRFRQDLLYRLNAVMIQLPPLRERVEDIPLLAEYFAARDRSTGTPLVTFSPAALDVMKNYNWQGNIRELENAVLHAASVADGRIYPEHLPDRVRQEGNAFAPPDASPQVREAAGAEISTSAEVSPTTETWPSLAEVEVQYVARVLAHTSGNKQAAARLLSIDRKTLTRILKRHTLEG